MRPRAIGCSASSSATAGGSVRLASSPARRSTSASRVLRKLNDAGLYANTTLLGEAIPDAEGAARRHGRVRADHRAPRRREAEGERRAQAHAPRPLLRRGARLRERRPARRARRRARHVRPHRHGAVGLTSRRRCGSTSGCATAGHDSVGTVLQAYLYRTPDDLERLLPLRAEPPHRQGRVPRARRDRLPREGDVDRAYVELVERGLARRRVHRGGDARRARSSATCSAFAAREGIARDRFEFQMLYGVRPALQRSIAAEGYKVLVARRSAPTGTRTSCDGSPSVRRTSRSS